LKIENFVELDFLQFLEFLSNCEIAIISVTRSRARKNLI
jgi:hypothetical protein